MTIKLPSYRLAKIDEEALKEAGGSLYRYYKRKTVDPATHERWMSGKQRPMLTRCPCHDKEVVLVYDFRRRKQRFVWLKDRQGNVRWHGEAFYEKGHHMVHNSYKFIHMLKAQREYEFTKEQIEALDGPTIHAFRRNWAGETVWSNDPGLPMVLPPVGTQLVTARVRWKPTWDEIADLI